MDPIPEAPLPAPVDFKDRRVALQIAGVLLTGVGILLLLACVVFFVRLSEIPPRYRPVQMLQSEIVSVALCVFLIVAGIGLFDAKRWARAVMLIFSWGGLACLFFSTVNFGFVVLKKVQMQQMQEMQQTLLLTMAQAVKLVVRMGMLAGVASVALLALALFLGSPHVKATCERFDPEPSWTDRRPLPVLAMTLYAILMNPIFLMLNGHEKGFELAYCLFGNLGLGLGMTWMALFADAAWNCYHMKPSAWWMLQGLWVSQMLAGVFALWQFPQDGTTVNGIPVDMARWCNLLNLLILAASCGYLLWIRRYFVGVQAWQKEMQP